jgi:5-methyltetrahydropteroyltriglutamate--homocysteine methyltransferase
MNDFPLFDDVGGFPLLEDIDKERFEQFYWVAYKALVNKKEKEVMEHSALNQYFINPIKQAMQFKIKSELDVINYPQLIDMIVQFLKPIADYEMKPDLIDLQKAYLPEMFVINEYAKDYYHETGTSLKVKICVTGPIELYIKKHNFTIYSDLVLNFAKSVNAFIKNSIINTKYMETSIISIDEPSFGYVDLFNVNDNDLINIFDKSLEGINATTQIHLHSLNRAIVPLQTKKIDVLTCEYASDPTNKIPKRELEQYDKFIRVGIIRTNIDNIIGEKIETGKTWDDLKSYEGMLTLIDSKDRVKKNLLEALKLYGDRLKYIGPDCSLKGWRIPEVAYELLCRTRDVIQEVKKLYK